MTTITIPKELAKKGDLVLIPRREHELLLRIKMKGIAQAVLTSRQKRAIRASEEELKKGAYVTLNELERRVARARRKARQ
ncbi:MAG: hypothetical protein HYT82_01630 [Candidatus Harrisonbacteria bacterium]|nr:hypothetical protein [Candidatus Harrisonbacteria bacterium]MBI2405960.1 hypothetical protein [Candidatus Harrisonbacteria bacterium]